MKKILISLLSIIFVISMISTVYAAAGTMSSRANTDTVIKGKTFAVTITATADSPIDGMYTKFSYDKNVLSLESAVPGEGYGSDSSGDEILLKNNSSTESPKSATLYTMTFKVLDNANVEATKITFTESALHLNVGETLKDTPAAIDEVIINIKADDTTAGGQGQDPSNDDDNNNDGNGGNSNNGNKDKNTTKLPQTGKHTSLIVIVVLGIVSIFSFISYRKYNKYNIR